MSERRREEIREAIHTPEPVDAFGYPLHTTVVAGGGEATLTHIGKGRAEWRNVHIPMKPQCKLSCEELLVEYQRATITRPEFDDAMNNLEAAAHENKENRNLIGYLEAKEKQACLDKYYNKCQPPISKPIEREKL